MIDKLQTNLEDAMKGKTTIDKVARDIKHTFNTTAYESRRLAQNEAGRMAIDAQDAIARSAGVEEIMWSATLDDRTVDYDASLDGKVWGIDKEHPRPIYDTHVLCRCLLISVPYKGWQPTQRKNNISKELIDYVDYNSWKSGLFKKVINGMADLTTLQVEAIAGYKDFGNAINQTIRKREGFNISESAATYVPRLEEILKNTELATETQVYRGVSAKALEQYKDIVKKDPSRMIGVEISDKAFMSTSKNIKVASENFMTKDKRLRGDDILMEIRVPKGSHALELGDFSLNNEDEILLMNNSRIKIVGVEDTRKVASMKMKEVDDLTKPIGEESIFGQDYEQKLVSTGEKQMKGYIKLIGEVINE